jgi:hypothetical protein
MAIHGRMMNVSFLNMIDHPFVREYYSIVSLCLAAMISGPAAPHHIIKVGARTKQAKRRPAFQLRRILQIHQCAWVVTVLTRYIGTGIVNIIVV